MTLLESLDAVKNKKIVFWNDDYDRWGIASSLSDDETIIYYNPKGTSLFYCSAIIKNMSIQLD